MWLDVSKRFSEAFSGKGCSLGTKIEILKKGVRQAPEGKKSLVIFEICELPVDSICMISLEFLPINQEPDRSIFFSNIFF